MCKQKSSKTCMLFIFERLRSFNRTMKTKYDISKISILMRLEKDDMIRVFLIVKVKTNKSSKLVENMINSDNSIRSS